MTFEKYRFIIKTQKSEIFIEISHTKYCYCGEGLLIRGSKCNQTNRIKKEKYEFRNFPLFHISFLLLHPRVNPIKEKFKKE